jgi:hypothetical protein|nr:MAG TPA: hypothetical protein [Caudoviricetes sp.]
MANILECGGFVAVHKPLADSTLKGMRKEELIRLIRILESNYEVANERIENQLKHIEALKREIVNDKKTRTILNNSSVWRGNEQRDRKQTENRA